MKIDCVREVLNFSTIQQTDRFDKKTFDKKKFLEKLSISSPSLEALLRNIEKLDTQDSLKHKKLFKHFIFSDIKKGYGAKIIASGFVAAGYNSIIHAQGSILAIDEETLKTKNESKFAVLSSTSIYNAETSPRLTKSILSVFNKRPENTYGKDVRFIIIDSGFKEGIDLFDVKYCHIFEEQKNPADLVQSIGRATRYCGSNGLRFNKGWELEVFNYISINIKASTLTTRIGNFVFPKKKKGILKNLQEKDPEMSKRLALQTKMLDIIKDNAIDKLLNENINNNKNKSSNALKTVAIIGGTALLGGGVFVGGKLLIDAANKKRRS
jgi:hypothetical protein